MVYTDAHKRADVKYKKDKTTQVCVRFYNATEGELLDYLQSLPNKQGYIKQLIREDMERKNLL